MYRPVRWDNESAHGGRQAPKATLANELTEYRDWGCHRGAVTSLEGLRPAWVHVC